MRWFEWKSSVNLLANRSCSHLSLLRLRDAVTDAWSPSDIFSCAASRDQGDFWAAALPDPRFATRRKPDENIVRRRGAHRTR